MSAPRDGLAGSDEAVRQQIIKYLAEQFPRSTLLDRAFGADHLVAIFAEHAARVRAEADEHYARADSADLTDAYREMDELSAQLSTVRAEVVADERVSIVAELEAAGHLAAMNLIAVCGGPTFDERIAEAVAEERQRIAVGIRELPLVFEHDGALLSKSPEQVRSDAVAFAAGSVPVATPHSLQRRLFAECETAGWDPDKRNSFAEECAHLHEEVSEAFREWRLHKDFGIRSDESGKPTGIPIELADVLIGLFYNAELHGFDLLGAVEIKHRWNLTRDYQAEGRMLHPVATPAEPPTFDQLLSDPLEQFDRRSELLPAILRHLCSPDVGALLRSIEEYRNAPPAAATTASVVRPGPDAPTEEVSGGSGHAERQEPAELTVLRREIRHSLLKDVSVQTVDRWLNDFARLSAADEVARYRAAISELHAIMDAAIVRGGYRPGESERIEALLAAALGDGE